VKIWRARRAGVLLLLLAGMLGVTTVAWGQYASQTGNVVGTVGGACNSSINTYGWPDTNGDILKCVSNVWTLVTQPATAAGSIGYVQFNSSGVLGASSYLFWDNANFRLGIGSSAPVVSLDLSQRTDALALPVGTQGQEPASPMNGMIRYSTTANDVEAYIAGAWTTLTTGGSTAAITLGTSAATPNPASPFSATTGLFSPASGVTAITAAGTEMMRVNASGVGIGTANPSYNLSVAGTFGTANGGLTADANGVVYFNNNVTTSWPSSGMGIGQRYGLPTIFNATALMNFSGTGIVNIAPASGGGYNIGGDTGISRGAADKLYVGNGTAGDYSGTLIASSVGIGTTSPDALLSLGGQSARTIDMVRETTASTAGNNLTLQAGGATPLGTDKAGGSLALSSGISTGTGSSGINFNIYKAAGSSGSADNSATTAMTVTGAGNVGIGTTSPLSILSTQLSGTPAANTPYIAGYNQNGVLEAALENGNVLNTYGGQLYLADAGGDTVKLQVNTGSPLLVTTASTLSVIASTNRNRLIFGTSYISLYDNSSGNVTEYLTGGNVGIGTSTMANKLEVNGSVAIGTQYVDTAAPTSGLIVSGNVGIGTATPTGNLQIYSGTQTTSVPALNLTQTWNNNATAFDAPLLENITATAYGPNSLLADLQVGGTSEFSVSPAGVVAATGNIKTGGYLNINDTTATPIQIQGTNFISRPGSSSTINLLDSSNGYWQTLAIFTGNGVTTTEKMRITSTGNVGIGSTSPVVSLDLSQKTDALALPVGTQAQEPASPMNGMIRYSTTANDVEAYVAGAWTTLTTGGATASITLGTSAALPNPASSFGATTGLFSPASGVVGVTSAGTEMMRVNGTGVGIGTTSPSYLLHVGSPSAVGVVADFQNSSGYCTFSPSANGILTTCTSDVRLKKDIVDAGDALAWLGTMRIRDFALRATGERRTGVIAQEMMKVHPEMVRMGATGFYQVDVPDAWKLIKAIQELKADNDKLAASLKAANDNIADLRASFEAYKDAHP
jgi:hypothetical protein